MDLRVFKTVTFQLITLDLCIIKRLFSLYNDMRELNNFSRQANEDIKRTMQKAKVAVGDTTPLGSCPLTRQKRKSLNQC